MFTTVPGTAWVFGHTIAAEFDDISRFVSSKKLVVYTPLRTIEREFDPHLVFLKALGERS